MASFEDFLKELKTEVKDLVEKGWKDLIGQASGDVDEFLKQSEADLRRWTQLLANGSLKLQDFEFLLAAKKDVASLTALKRAGLAQVQLDRFLNGVVGAILRRGFEGLRLGDRCESSLGSCRSGES
jgi:hypothetical protein